MRHPFAEVMPPDDDRAEFQRESATEPHDRPSRRSVLSRMFALLAGAAGVVSGRGACAQADDKADRATDGNGKVADKDVVYKGNGKAAKDYVMYLVVPKSIRKFTTKRREELGVRGPYVHGWEGNELWEDSKGFLAWGTTADEEKILDADDIHAVHTITAKDKIVTGAPNRSRGKLSLAITPNGWPEPPEADRYFSTKQLSDAWSKQFSDQNQVSFTPSESSVEIQFKKANIDSKIVDAIAACPQVSHLAWEASPTTKALGEEGGPTTGARWEEGGPTTKAIGEEGGPSTRRRGEEGGGPRPTTLRVGEEGATTLALGEEGGGPRPIPRPLPRPVPLPRATTEKLGEEGGALPRL